MNMQPAATVAAVCLAAYFALRNERKKKALEIRTTQLDRISELVNRASTNLMQYTGSLASILEARQRRLSTEQKFDINVISKWKDCLDESEVWAIDIQHSEHVSTAWSFIVKKNGLNGNKYSTIT